MSPTTAPSAGRRCASPGRAWLALFALTVAGLLGAAPARAQLPPSTNPLGYLVWASPDGAQMLAYADLYSVQGLQAGAGSTGTTSGPGNTMPDMTFGVRFTSFQHSNLLRLAADGSGTARTWYVVFTDSSLSGGQGTYTYWTVSGMLRSISDLPADSGGGINLQLKVQPVSEAVGSPNCTVTASGASGACVLPAARFVPSMAPASPLVDQRARIRVVARDMLGQRVRSYIGKVHFTATRPDGTAVRAQLPPDYTFRSTDSGRHVFEGAVFRQTGSHLLTVTDTANPSLRGRMAFTVAQRSSTTSTTVKTAP